MLTTLISLFKVLHHFVLAVDLKLQDSIINNVIKYLEMDVSWTK